MEDPIERREEQAFRSPDGRGPEGEPVTPAPKARQGVTSGRVVTILVVGIALVLVGFALSWMVA